MPEGSAVAHVSTFVEPIQPFCLSLVFIVALLKALSGESRLKVAQDKDLNLDTFSHSLQLPLVENIVFQSPLLGLNFYPSRVPIVCIYLGQFRTSFLVQKACNCCYL